MQFRALVPNTLTMANLCCGVLAIHSLYSDGNYHTPALFIGLAALLDVFDGLAARMLKVSGALGAQLDSLADAVSFGVAPALIIVQVMGGLGGSFNPVVLYSPLLLAVASVYRLAKFNLDARQKTGFRGLPTPANALFWIAVAHLYASGHEWSALLRPATLVPLIVLMSAFMVSEVPLIALKFNGLSFEHNRYRYLLVGVAVLVAVLSWVLYRAIFPAVPIVLLLYLLISTMDRRQNKHP